MWRVLLLALFVSGAISLSAPAGAEPKSAKSAKSERPSAARAKAKGKASSKGKRAKKRRPRRSQAGGDARVSDTPAGAAAITTDAPTQDDPAPAEPEKLGVAGEGSDKKPRVYTFGGLDVEGKLRTPQLLYFRARVKQELDTSSGQKRSFLKELEQTADINGL